MSQISALLADKESRTTTQQKIDSQLIYGARMADSREAAPGVPSLDLHVRFITAKNRLLVEIDVRTNGGSKANATAAARIVALGGQIIAAVPQFDAIHAALPIEQVEALATLDEVRFIRSAPVRESDTGSVNSQGDRAHAADTARSTYSPYMGNVRICVISDSATAAGIANSVANGNLSAGQVTVLPGQEGSGSNEGLAMLEIVNDLAPGAKLYFATSGSSEATFAQNILGLYNSYKCDVMVDDIRFSTELPFQDSIIARAVNTVTAVGTIYFASAGNSGNKTDGTSGTWVGDFVNGGTFTVPGVPTAYEVHSFQTTPSVQNYNVVNAGGSSYALSLFWSDPEDASTNDYDVFQLNAAGTAVVSSSTTTQNGTQTPFEFATLASTGGNRVVVVRKTGAASRALYVSTGRGRLAINTNGFARGHSAAIDAIALAAVPAFTQFNGASPAGPFPGEYTAAQQTELFSSDGPARKFFHPNGTPVTPGNFLIGTGGGLTQQYPVVTAADGVTTSVSGFAPFYGTSAAAPHAAAIAGLLKGYNPTLTPAQIRAALVATALDIEAPGVDNDTGAGIVRPANALATLTPSGAPFAGTASLVTESFGPANGFVDVGETITVNLPIINGGSAALGNVVATLQSSANVTPLAVNPQTYGAMAASGTTVTRPFTFTAAGVCGDSFDLNVQVQDGPTNFGTLKYPFKLGTTQTTVFTLENFDAVTVPALPAGWTSTVVTGAIQNWTTSNTTPDSAPNAISAAPLATVAEVQLDSPSYAIPAGSGQQLRFRHRWNTESGWDGGVLEISIAGGAFTDIIAAGGTFVSGGYTAILGTGAGSSPLAGREAWSGSSNTAYTTTAITLPPAALGQNIVLRFRLASDSSTLASGTNVWRIDTLERVVVTPVCAVDGGGVSSTVALSVTGPVHRGQQSTVTGTVITGSGTPTGTVTVTGAGGTCSMSLVSGSGTCALTPTTVGASQAITGFYGGAPGVQPSVGSASLTVKSALDVDDNGQSEASSDGVLALRYLFGLRGAALTDGITFGAGAQRTDPAAITAYLAQVNSVFDVDGNGQFATMTDGLMLIRYLLGLRGSALVQGAAGASGAVRTTSGDLQTYIGGLVQ